MKVIITQGIPGSGKSSWAKNFVQTNQGWIRVNRDDLRSMAGKYWVPSREPLITLWENACIYGVLDGGYNLVIDAMNLHQSRLAQRISDLTQRYPGIEIETKFFNTPLEVCIERDSLRENPVGEETIRKIHNDYKHVIEKMTIQ